MLRSEHLFAFESNTANLLGFENDYRISLTIGCSYSFLANKSKCIGFSPLKSFFSPTYKKKSGFFGPLHGHICLPKFLLVALIVFVLMLADLYLSYGLPLLLAAVRFVLVNGVKTFLLIGVHFRVFYALTEFHGFVD